MRITIFILRDKKWVMFGVFLIFLSFIAAVRLPTDGKKDQSSSSHLTTNLYKTNTLRLNDKFQYAVRSFVQNQMSANVKQIIELNVRKNKTQPLISKQTKFPCNTQNSRSLTKPTSVHRLRPGDIDIIGNIGDSLTAGYGMFATGVPSVFVEYRGFSFVGGGTGTWRESLTLPNILKEFNPNLYGYSYGGPSLSQQRGSQFNVGELGAVSDDLFSITKELVRRIKMSPRVNLQEDWKLITMFIGSNTFCLQICTEDNKKLLEGHKQILFESLLYLKNQLPRTMVVLLMSANLEFLTRIVGKPLQCHLINLIECPCLTAMQYRKNLPKYIKVMKEFQIGDKEIAENELFKNSEDFTVALQTVTNNISIPLNKFNKTDFTYTSEDCFHLSQKGYARGANALWNSMLQPFGHKTNEWNNTFEKFACPTDRRPYIATWKNSL